MILITDNKGFDKWIQDDDESLGPAHITSEHYKLTPACYKIKKK